jgi:multidrug resistance efflux pump
VNTDPRRKAAETYRKRREMMGVKVVSVRLTQHARAALDELKGRYGTKDAAVEAAISELFSRYKLRD